MKKFLSSGLTIIGFLAVSLAIKPVYALPAVNSTTPVFSVYDASRPGRPQIPMVQVDFSTNITNNDSTDLPVTLNETLFGRHGGAAGTWANKGSGSIGFMTVANSTLTYTGLPPFRHSLANPYPGYEVYVDWTFSGVTANFSASGTSFHTY